MATIQPFRGIRYDPSAVDDLARVFAPPYDVINDEQRTALERLSPHNIVRLILGRDEPEDDETSNKYTRARGLLEAWLTAGVLVQDEQEALYVYEERYPFEGETRMQRGVLAAVTLGEPGGDGVLPHERTYDHIVDDRLALLRETEANLDCIFCVTDALDRAAHEAIERVAAGEPLQRATTSDGIEHLVWAMTDERDIAAVAKAVASAQVVIADGHHRHRTAQTYAAERRSTEGPGPWDAQLMYVADATHHGPTLLPIHRTIAGVSPEDVLAALKPAFKIEPADASDPDALAAELTKKRIYGRTFAVLADGQAWWATVSDQVAEREAMPADRSAAWRDLDVAVLHAFVFETLLGGVTPTFQHHPAEVAEAIAAGEATVGFLLPPMPFEDVRAVAETGEPMPQKSTFFVPKPTTGMVLRPLWSEHFDG